MSLADALERAASALPAQADAIRPANGDPARVLSALRPEGARAVLAWLLSHEPDAGDELATAWSEEEGGAPVLLGLGEEGLSKPGRKALRRVLHRLRAKGLAPPPAAPAKVVATLPRVDEDVDAAFLSPIDPSGARVGYLVESVPGAGARLYEMVLDDERGVVEFSAYTATRGEARRFVRLSLAREGAPAAPEDPNALRALLARIAAHQPADRTFPRAFTEWRGRATARPGDARTPGERVRAELGDESTPERLRRAAELVASGTIGPWPAPLPLLRTVAETIQEAMKSRLVVSGAQRRERLEMALSDAIAQVFDGPRAERTAARLEETAAVLQRSDREDDARACLAAARGLRDGPAAEQPVARALLEAALGPLLQKLREEEESSLIVKP